MSIPRKAAFAASAIIGAAALTAALTSPARASAWDYGYGSASTITAAHGLAITDLVGTWYGCTMLSLVSDTNEGGTWYAVEKGWCIAPR